MGCDALPLNMRGLGLVETSETLAERHNVTPPIPESCSFPSFERCSSSILWRPRSSGLTPVTPSGVGWEKSAGGTGFGD